jgi:sulfite reductase (NADPH) flavoprotein alpha-component
MLISISGSILIIKRQQGVKHFFDKIKKDFFSQYFHVVSGRLLLIPVLVIAITGTYLFMIRFEFIPKGKMRMSLLKRAMMSLKRNWQISQSLRKLSSVVSRK